MSSPPLQLSIWVVNTCLTLRCMDTQDECTALLVALRTLIDKEQGRPDAHARFLPLWGELVQEILWKKDYLNVRSAAAEVLGLIGALATRPRPPNTPPIRTGPPPRLSPTYAHPETQTAHTVSTISGHLGCAPHTRCCERQAPSSTHCASYH